MLKFTDNYPLSKITTLQIGGPAKKFVAVKSQEELLEALKYAKEDNLTYLIIGGGSNLLVADEGTNCLVIKNEITGISTWEESKPTSQVSNITPLRIRVKSGTPLQELVDYTTKHGLSGLEKLAGIPGTVGGAVFGNAGAYGQTISDHLVSVTILNPSVIPTNPDLIGAKVGSYKDKLLYGSQVPFGRLRAGKPGMTNERSGMTGVAGMTKEECNFQYRNSAFKKNHHIILEVIFSLKPTDPQTLQLEAQNTITKRLIKYPTNIKCPGSFFKNIIAKSLPKEVLAKIPKSIIVYGKTPAGALLEMVGAHGQCLDGIAIAPYHANLFINEGGGTAKAFYNLAKTYQQKVKEKFGITLEPEVQLINLPPLS